MRARGARARARLRVRSGPPAVRAGARARRPRPSARRAGRRRGAGRRGCSGCPGARRRAGRAGHARPVVRASCTASTGCARTSPRERPLCLVIDDAHWADTPSLRYLAFLVPRLEELPVALAARRPTGRGRGTGSTLLASLSGEPSAQLVAPGAAQRRRRRQARGRGARAGSGARLRVGLPRARPAGTRSSSDSSWPGSRRTPSRRAPRRPPASRRSARAGRRAGSCCGSSRLPAPAAPLARSLAILERGELAHAAGSRGSTTRPRRREPTRWSRPASSRPDARSRSSTRSCAPGIYADVGVAERALAHRRAARLLDAAGGTRELVAEHLLAADPAGDPWVVERLVGAARAAARARGARARPRSTCAARSASRPGPGERSALLLELGVAEDNAGQDGAYAHMESALDAAGDARAPGSRPRSCSATRSRATTASRRPSTCSTGPRRAGIGAAERLVLAAEALAASIATFSPATAAAHAARIRAARSSVERDRSPTHEQLALAGQLAVRANEPAGVAAGLALRALATAGGAHPEPTDLPWFHQCAVTLLWSESYGELGALLDDAVASARARGDAGLLLRRARVPGLARAAARRAGSRGGGRAHGDRGREPAGAEDVPGPQRRGAARGARRAGRARRGGAGARPDRRGGARRLDDRGDAPAGARAAAAGAAARRGRAGGLRRRRRGRRSHGRSCPPAACPGARTPRSRSWRSATPRPPAASPITSSAGARVRRPAGARRRAPGGGRSPRARSACCGSPWTCSSSADARVELARSVTELGALLRRGGRRADARAILGRARDLAHRAGARSLAARAETELRATGAKPRRILLTGVEALTASERRVAEFAAQGLRTARSRRRCSSPCGPSKATSPTRSRSSS